MGKRRVNEEEHAGQNLGYVPMERQDPEGRRKIIWIRGELKRYLTGIM